MSKPQGHCAAGRIMSMKKSNDTIGNRTRDLPACSAVPQPTAPPRAPIQLLVDGVLTPKYVGVIRYKFTVLICAYVGI